MTGKEFDVIFWMERQMLLLPKRTGTSSYIGESRKRESDRWRVEGSYSRPTSLGRDGRQALRVISCLRDPVKLDRRSAALP